MDKERGGLSLIFVVFFKGCSQVRVRFTHAWGQGEHPSCPGISSLVTPAQSLLARSIFMGCSVEGGEQHSEQEGFPVSECLGCLIRPVTRSPREGLRENEFCGFQLKFEHWKRSKRASAVYRQGKKSQGRIKWQCYLYSCQIPK